MRITRCVFWVVAGASIVMRPHSLSRTIMVGEWFKIFTRACMDYTSTFTHDAHFCSSGWHICGGARSCHGVQLNGQWLRSEACMLATLFFLSRAGHHELRAAVVLRRLHSPISPLPVSDPLHDFTPIIWQLSSSPMLSSSYAWVYVKQVITVRYGRSRITLSIHFWSARRFPCAGLRGCARLRVVDFQAGWTEDFLRVTYELSFRFLEVSHVLVVTTFGSVLQYLHRLFRMDRTQITVRSTSCHSVTCRQSLC